MTELSDEEVFGKPRELSDAEVFGRPDAPTYGNVSESIPEAFLDRVRAGQALSRILSAAGHEAQEGMTGQTPTGYSDDRLAHMIDIGVFHDPLKSRPGPIQMANEAVLFPVAQAWQGLTTAINAGIHGVGGAAGQLVEEFGGSQGTANRAKNEIINAGNWALIEGGMGRFSRPAATPEGVMDQTVGGLPRPEDFTNAGKVLDSPHAETNLKRMWQEDGITPAEAVHDAQSDAFLKNEITARQVEVIAEAKAQRLLESAVPARPDNSIVFVDAAKVDAMLGPMNRTYVAEKRIGAKEFIASEPDNWNPPHLSARVNSRNGKDIVDIVDGQHRWAAMRDNDMGVVPVEMDAASVKKARSMGLIEKKPEVTLSPADLEVLTETGGKPGSLGAAATEPGDIPLSIQPASPPGSLAASFQSAANTLLDIGRDAQMLVAPMARGTKDSMAIAKDFANSLRRNRWDWNRIDTDIAKRFTPEQRARMWNAADEESVSRQLEEPASMREHQGFATLEPAERAAVEELQTRAQNAWLRARDLGMVEGEGLPAYTPRMIINTAGASSKEAALALNSIGGNLKTKTANMLKRKYLESQETEAAAKAKYGDQAALARDIRVLPLATAHLEDAISGRSLINNIKDYGAKTGADTVVEGAIPAGSETKWFTMDHPAFRTWRPQLREIEGKVQAVKDAEGNVVFEQVPLYVHGDFEGPLRAVLSQKSGALYGGMMSLKGKTMSLIMNSPMIHNAVEWGRALPAMPGKVATFKVYFEGNRAKNNPAIMGEAIDNGLVPIGHRFFNQDISGLMESPDLTPGRSWTAKLLAAVPGLFDEAAGVAVKRAIDKAGDFWHNTLLWDRVADLQMGLYTNLRADAIAKGIDPQTSSRLAAHWANRYAGALPKEAMSDAATKVANMLLFSRSFTMGNLGVMKDMLTGLPKDVLAQIERDAGLNQRTERITSAAVKFNDKIYTGDNHLEALEKAAAEHGVSVENIHTKTNDSKQSQFDAWTTSSGRLVDSKEAAKIAKSPHEKLDSSDPEFLSQQKGPIVDAVTYAKSLARRKAMTVVLADVALMYVGNSLLQSAINVLRGDNTLEKELHRYAERFNNVMQEVHEHPLKLIQPMNLLEEMSSTSENEPGKKDRIRVGTTGDGQAVYMRNPVGKIGEEFTGYMTGPLDMMRKKLGTVARPGWQIMSNDAGFGRKVYDPDADTPAKYLKNLGMIAAHLAKSQFPESQFDATVDLVKGVGDAKLNAAKAFGPFAGVTFSKGAPGGPAMGEIYAAKRQHDFEVQMSMPGIRRQIQLGDISGAQDRMDELGIPPSMQRFTIKTTLDPATRMSPKIVRDFYRYATPEQKARVERLQGPARP